MTVEDAQADVSCLLEERGPEFALSRFGVTLHDIEHLCWMAHEDPNNTATLLHGVLLGLALGEMREKT